MPASRFASSLRRSALPLVGGLGLLFGLLSCASGRLVDGDGENGNRPASGPGSLWVQPADVEMTVDGKSPLSITYQVMRQREDVSGQVTLSIDDEALGTFQGPTFNYRPGGAGKSTVRARLGDDTGETSLTLRADVVVIGPGAPGDAPTKFGGAPDPGAAPDFVYPPNGALIPPNLNLLEFHFQPKNADLFEIKVVTDTLNLRMYSVCKTVGTGCVFQPDEKTWKLISSSARNHTAEITIRGTRASGGGVGQSVTNKLSFAQNDMLGGIYYWAASAGGVVRYDFGLRAQKPEVFYNGLRAGALCVGCHALSRSGKRIAVGMNIPGPAMLRSLDVGSRGKLFEVGSLIPGMGGSDFQSWSPDGQWLITNEYGGLTIRDGETGTVQGKMPQIAPANMPDVSPDGKSVVFARGAWTPCFPPLICPTLSISSAGLFTVPFMGKDGFGTPVEIVPAAGSNNYYPSYSPDGRFIVFNRSSSDSYNAPTARVMIVPASGGTPIDLASTNTVLGNSWPKWSPFHHKFQGATILWLTFASARAYGVRSTMGAQIWMVPVDIAKLAAGMDPGYPPIWLPFQDPNTDNRIAQWVEKVDRAPCTVSDTSKCGAGEFCVDGFCTPVIQ
jgi:hypothetical protein